MIIPMVRLLEPQTVLQGRYKIAGPIGQGGMGAVYRAEDILLPGRICALKEVAPDPESAPEIVMQIQEQFRREAEVLARLDHPNLPKVSDYFTANAREYLVMDFVPGHDLRELVNEARAQREFLPEPQVLVWSEQLCEALAYLHAQEPSILHRDLKPSNIKLTPSGLIKLVDFGLVKILTGDESRTVTVIQGRGTAAYTPLEQYGGDDAHTDTQSDIYALGATLYNLLTGRPPATARERFLNTDALITPRTLNPAISPHVERAILQALALHPKERPQTVASFKKLLQHTQLSDNIEILESRSRVWRKALHTNLPLVLTLLALLTVALLLTP